MLNPNEDAMSLDPQTLLYDGFTAEMPDRLVSLEEQLDEAAIALDRARKAVQSMNAGSSHRSTSGKALNGRKASSTGSSNGSISPTLTTAPFQKRKAAPSVATPSCFCLDILEMEGAIRLHLNDQAASSQPESHVSLDTLVQRGLLSLVRDRWKWSRSYYFETSGLEKLGPITRWRVSPTYEHYMAVQPQFRPTKLQIARFHWPIIDWFTFPNVRDKMIEHAHELDLTDVLLTLMNAYCMEVNVIEPYWDPAQYQSVDGRSPVDLDGLADVHIKYYRLKDYIDHVGGRENDCRRDLSASERPQISKALEAKFILALSSPDTWFQLEMSFFERYPMLYCSDAVVRGTYASIYDREED